MVLFILFTIPLFILSLDDDSQVGDETLAGLK